METTEVKTTKDLYLAAAFLAMGAKYEGADRTDPKNMEFKFSPKTTDSASLPSITVQNLDDIEKQWINETLVISATKYANAIKKMKSLVHTRE